MLWLWMGFREVDKKGNHVVITDRGINVTTFEGEVNSQHAWDEISEVTMEFKPPVFYPALHLINGDIVHLECASTKEVMKICCTNGIKVNDKLFNIGN